MIRRLIVRAMSVIMIISDSYVHRHAIAQVFVSCNEDIAQLVLEMNGSCMTMYVVQTIEVLDGRNDGLGRIVWKYLDSHW